VSLKKDLRSLQQGGEPEIHERVDLRAWTALGVGGTADLLIRCRSADGLQRALDLLATHGRQWLVLGSGSRLVPSDRGLRVPVLNLSGSLGLWELELEGAVAGGGAMMAQVCRAAARTGLPGTQPLAAASSTVGGVIQASGRGDFPLDGVLDWVEVARPGAAVERLRLTTRSVEPDSRRRLDLRRRVVIRARLHLAADGRHDLHRRRGDAGGPPPRRPRTTAPVFVGSEGVRAETVLADAGCLGLTVGGASLASDGANRVSTAKNARAAEVLDLVRLARDRVTARTGTVLRSALCFVDEDGEGIDP
jgi:UDP-N-acetylmuramate dehydrogenase